MLRQKLPPTQRENELRQTKLGLTAVPSNLSDSDLVIPHHLCDRCETVFSSSRQVRNLVLGTGKDIKRSLSWGKKSDTLREDFAWVTPQELRSAHLRRCHFCLIALQRLCEDSKFYSKLLWPNFHERHPDVPLTLEIYSREGQCIAGISGRSGRAFSKGCALATLSTAAGEDVCPPFTYLF